MANNLTSNITSKVARVFTKAFESSRVLSKTVNTTVIEGEHDASTGDTVYLKRPHQYGVLSTAAGDISTNRSDIISGKIPAVVQNFLTVPISWTSKNEALDLDQLEEILAPAATNLVNKLESNLGSYMMINSGVAYGTPGTAVDAWSDVAGCGSMLLAQGAPAGVPSYYAANPFSVQTLADAQNGLAGNDRLIASAWEKAQVSRNFGGIQMLTSNNLPSFTSSTAADRAGTLTGPPTLTYVGAKDTMTQTWAVTAFSNAAEIKAGDIIEVTGKYIANMQNGVGIKGADGALIKKRGTVLEDVTLGSSGEGNIIVSAAGIWESGGAYNNMTSALATSDVVTLITASATLYQPNLYYSRDAFALASIKLDKLFSTDTIATTKDGMSIRISKYADGNASSQTMRADLVPAFATLNSLWAGQAYGI